jgi:hypothetical protein
MSADCCTHDCRQGRDCPARMARVTPQADDTATPLNTGNSDGSDPHRDSTDELLDDTGLMLLQGIALLVFIVYASL